MATLAQIRSGRRKALRRILIELRKPDASGEKAERRIKALMRQTNKIPSAGDLALLGDIIKEMDTGINGVVRAIADAATVFGTV